MLNNLLTKFARVRPLPMKEELNLQGLNWCEHEKSWVLIYFSTSWCAPCKSMAPIMVDVSEHYVDQLNVIKIDVDEQTQLAKQLEVTGVPSLVLLGRSGTKSRLIGGVNIEEINHWLSEQLNHNTIK
ncbi:thioredoxin family protein [Colwellia demingiae]|uniref:Thioredoxin family protein n=2 Tax=Colwellia demingiae TaxID=89401 RepID=A0A5C6QCX9_9GAMM|nr:thioredoxin family protein [Colwellia demingiae]